MMDMEINRNLLTIDKRFFSKELEFDFEERAELIDKHKKELLYICRQLKGFNKDVAHVILNRMPISMISNLAYNLEHNLVSCLIGMTVYDYLSTSYLLGENYNDNYRLWKIYTKFAKETETLINNLEEENVFEIDEYPAIENLIAPPNSGKSAVRSLLNLEHMLSKINGNGLFNALLNTLRSIANRLEIIKTGLHNLTDEDFELIYQANYNFYKINYWPSEVKNFRLHIEEHYFPRKDNKIDVLNKLLWDETYQFEQTETGRLWKEHIHDKKALYFEMKKTEFTENQWKYFFKKICCFEEFKCWINELEQGNISCKTIRDFVVRPELADDVFNKIRDHIQSETKPKEIVKPFRAAMDAGVLERPSWDAFVADFGKRKIKSDSSFNSYTNPETKPYSGPAYDVLVGDFKKLLE